MSILGILGKKIEMTQIFREDGTVVPVTAIETGPCTVTQIRTVINDGYEAVQLGFQDNKRANKPDSGHTRLSGGKFRHLKEVPVTNLSEVRVGQQFDVSMFEAGQEVDVTALPKGRGFQGGVKRHGFAGGPKTHGQSDRHRAPGSVGGGTFPGRVLKGWKMAGHMGANPVTTRNLEVILADPERNLLFVKGSVPGARNGLVLIRRIARERRKVENQ